MPSRIVVVHDETEFVTDAVAALKAQGCETKGYTSSSDAIAALSEADKIELLITKIRFPPGTPHGVSLALMARTKRPGIRVLFTDSLDLKQHTEGIGELMALPISVPELVEKANQLLSRDRLT